MIRIGVVGPQDTVEKILSLRAHFENEAEFVAEVYADNTDIAHGVEQIKHQVDCLLFSGEAPYVIARNAGVLDVPTIYIPREGTSFYRTLWEIKQTGKEFSRISSDVVSLEVMRETIQELGEEFETGYYLKFDGEMELESFTKFHKDLYEAGKTDVAITGFTKVYQELMESNIPAFKIYPTQLLIRDTINKLILMGQVKKENEGRIAVQVIKIREKNISAYSDYQFLLMRNHLEQNLIQYAKDTFGTIFPLGRDEYIIFTNRSGIDTVESVLPKQLDTVAQKYPQFIFASGIGLGHTVYGSESLARTALSYAVKENDHALFVLDESNNIRGPYKNEDQSILDFKLSSSENELIRKISLETHLSIANITKLLSVTTKLNSDIVEANVVAQYLGIAPRSARRILNQLLEHGYAEIVDTVQRAKNGRPSKQFRLKLHDQ